MARVASDTAFHSISDPDAHSDIDDAGVPVSALRESEAAASMNSCRRDSPFGEDLRPLRPARALTATPWNPSTHA
jgi:hypothetical protein